MSTEAQKARNARKRAKLRAHKQQAKSISAVEKEPFLLWSLAAFGNKASCSIPDYELGDPVIPTEFFTAETDFIYYEVETDLDVTADEVKALVRREVEATYGFNKHDVIVRVMLVERCPKH